MSGSKFVCLGGYVAKQQHMKPGHFGARLLPLSERATKQVQKVIGEFNRSRGFLFAEERSAAQATLQ
jgi:hypothetical protein